MELFAHTVQLDRYGDLVEEGGSSPKSNFDSFFNAFVTVFIVLTGEDWNNIYYSYARDNYFVSTIFFYSLIVFGQLILLNLFLAILLDNFDEVEEEERKRRNKKKITETKNKVQGAITLKILNLFMESKKAELKNAQEKVKNHSSKSLDKFHLPDIKRKRVKSKFKRKDSDPFDSLNDIDMSREKLIDSHVGTVKRIEENKEPNLVTKKQFESHLNNLSAPKRFSIKSILKRVDTKKHKSTKNLPKLNFKNFFSMEPPKTLLANQKSRIQSYMTKKSLTSVTSKEAKKELSLDGTSLFIFSKRNKFRRFIGKIVKHYIFENFIIALIVVSSIALAIENPLRDPNSKLVEVLYIIDTILSSIFFLEANLKIITYGFLF